MPAIIQRAVRKLKAEHYACTGHALRLHHALKVGAGGGRTRDLELQRCVAGNVYDFDGELSHGQQGAGEGQEGGKTDVKHVFFFENRCRITRQFSELIRPLERGSVGLDEDDVFHHCVGISVPAVSEW